MDLYKTGTERGQLVLIPTLLGDLIASDNEVRVIDAFVDSLDLSSFKYSSPSSRGNKPYNPADLLKLFLFGYRHGVRSSRKLMYLANTNIECIWLLKNIHPDFRTISDFRKDNVSLLKDVLFQFNSSCNNLSLISSQHSQDGTKLKAVNSKDNNFTLSKIDDRKSRISNNIDSYLKAIELTDIETEKQEINLKVNELKNKLNLLQSYEKQITSSGNTQKSLTDPDSKLMRDNGKFTVGYNNQVCVDVNSHLVTNFKITDNPADIGSITDISIETKNAYNLDILTNVTDKGYIDRNDMINSLENGVIPEVTPLDGTSGFTLETIYEENLITDTDISSTKPEDIKKCLRAGVIPNVYKDNIASIEVKKVNHYEYIDNDLDDFSSISEDELRDTAISDKCFARHIDTDKVYCPMGEILRRKSKSSRGVRYSNKLACKNCKNPCCSSSFKVVDFQTDKVFVAKKGQKKNKKNKIKTVVKKVFITTKPNPNLLKLRMSTSEHPHASMKFWDHSNYLLLKGIEKVTGEVALYYCAYNIRRAINLLGVENLVNYFKYGTIPPNINEFNVSSQKNITKLLTENFLVIFLQKVF